MCQSAQFRRRGFPTKNQPKEHQRRPRVFRQNAALIIAFSVFGSFIKQHSEASGRIAGLAAQAEGAGDEFEEGVDEFEALRRISEDEGDQYDE